jgi:hypothetical protein
VYQWKIMNGMKMRQNGSKQTDGRGTGETDNKDMYMLDNADRAV